MGWEYEPTFRFFWETAIIGDNQMLRSCYYLHLVQGLSVDFRFEILDLLHK
jgi:hypothetical protein